MVGTYKFCHDSALHFDQYLANTDRSALVRFISESVDHGIGFKLQYILADCNRNYTSIQGRIKEEINDIKCYILISVPMDKKISLFFDRFMMLVFKPNPQCQLASLKVREYTISASQFV